MIMTSLHDDTVGAGFTPAGQAQTDTLLGAGTPVAGDWHGLALLENSHDRNVDAMLEREGEIGGFGDQNAFIGTHQTLGILAPDERSGDENRRLGFTLHGSIAANSDRDVYSFRGTAGSMVWLDIDHTDAGLDTVLELLDGNGNVLALSDSSRVESINGQLTYVNPLDADAGDAIGFPAGQALPMNLDPEARLNARGGGHRDLFTANDGDAGMRVVLPGSEGTSGIYYVRVRSHNGQNLSDPVRNNSNLADGLTQGGYQLQVRLQETDEIGGSVIRFADLRYASTAVLLAGLPAHAPLSGEIASDGDADLGNVGNSDRAAISIAGNASSSGDSYTFTVSRDRLQNAPGRTGADGADDKVSTVIDIDWADGLTRPNTSTFLYHDGKLVAIGTDSNVLDDRVTPMSGGLQSSTDVLDSSSFGSRDAFIGPLELSEQGQYEVIVSTNESIASELTQFTDPTSDFPLLRLEPLDSTVRIADDRFQIFNNEAPDPSQTPQSLQVAFEDDGSNAQSWHLGDIPLIALREDANSSGAARLSVYNPLTGRHDAIITQETGAPLAAAAQRPDGLILAIRKQGTSGRNDSNTSTTYAIDAEGGQTEIGSTGIGTYEHYIIGGDDPQSANRQANLGIEFESLAYYSSSSSSTQFLYGLANRGEFSGSTVDADDDGNDTVEPADSVTADNLVYLLDPDTGAAISRGGRTMPGGFESTNPNDPLIQDNYTDFDFPAETPWAGTDVVAQVQIPTTSPSGGNTGNVTSLATSISGSALYAFTDRGAVWRMWITTSGSNNYSAGDINGFPTLLVDPTVATPVGGTNFITDAQGNSLVFEQVTKGPANFHDAANFDDPNEIANLYFGVGRPVATPGESADLSESRRLYAFDLSSRTARPVFEIRCRPCGHR